MNTYDGIPFIAARRNLSHKGCLTSSDDTMHSVRDVERGVPSPVSNHVLRIKSPPGQHRRFGSLFLAKECTHRLCPWRLLTVLLFYVGVSFGRSSRMDSLKTLWEFDTWCNTMRDDRHYLITAMNCEKLLPGDFQCSSTELTENEFEVTCSLSQGSQAIKEICFTVSIYPSVIEARNNMFEFLSSSTAPVEYLKSLYASQDIPYGDVSFGRNFWGIGNCVFMIKRQTDDSLYVENVFRRIDSTLMTVPQSSDEFPAAVGFQSTQSSDNTREIVLHDSTAERTVIISSRDSLEITEDYSHIKVFNSDDQDNTVDIIIIEDHHHSTNTKIGRDNNSIINFHHRTNTTTHTDVTFLFCNSLSVTWHPLPARLQFKLFDCSGRLFRKWECKGEQGRTSLMDSDANKWPHRPAILQIEMINSAVTWNQTRFVHFME